VTGRRTVVGALTVGVLCAVAGPASAAPAPGGLGPGDHAFVNVSVATLWVAPDRPRDLDAPALGNPVELDRWNRRMEDTGTRRWLTGNLETQAVLGAEVEVTEVAGDWAHVVVLDQATPRDARGYPGWVPVRQLAANAGFAADARNRDRAVVTATRTWLSATPDGTTPHLEVSVTTQLPVLAKTTEGVRVALPDGSAAWLRRDAVDVHAPGEQPATPTGEDLVATATTFLGLRYLWAGASAYGLDCSGLTYTVHRAHGIAVPRDSGPQSTFGTAVPAGELQPGDLLFFAGLGGVGSVHHVGMYVGDGRMIHSPNAAVSVEIVDWEQWDTGHEFAGARRILPGAPAAGQRTA
jgi:gamma-D-glutamyl-L-lysine dipeptidyl-peptidase